jgi:putative transposase
MLIRKSFRYRLYPNADQQKKLAVQFGHARFVWNWGLNLRKTTYTETGQGISYNQLAGKLVELKNTPDAEWLKEADSQALQQKLQDLDRAYTNFFEKRAKFPRFKSKRDNQSIRYPQRFKFSAARVYLPKVGWVKAVFHRPLEGKAKNVTVSKTKTGKYFASIQCEVETPEGVPNNGEVGIDLGLKSFLVTSDGEKIDHPRHLQKAEKRLIRLQRHLSRRVKGSKGREKARVLLARQHEKVANQRSDFLHKTSRSLVDRYGFIGMEDLNVRGMVRNHSLAKSISSTGWGMFQTILGYKARWHGGWVEQVDRFYPSSKTCHSCRYALSDLPLSIREWDCPACGTHHDRDHNAAINILNQARAGVARSRTSQSEVAAGGERVSPGIQAVLDEAGSPPAFGGG